MIHKIMTGILLLFSLVLTGCLDKTNSADSHADPVSRGTIAISYLTGENPFFTTVAATIEHQAIKNGYTVLSWDAKNDSILQSRQIRNFIQAKVVAIVLIPCNSKEIGPVVREANEAGIPVFTADVAVQDPLAKVVCHVATDNYAGGKIAAEQVLKAINRKGKVAIVDWPGIESVQQRTKGFREVILSANNEGAQVELVASMPAYGSRENAKKTIKEILNDHPNIDAVFAINDPTAFGVLDVLKELNMAGKIKVVSFDGTKEAKSLVDQGMFYSDIVQMPEEIGNITFEILHKHLNNQPVSSQVLIPTRAYRGK